MVNGESGDDDAVIVDAATINIWRGHQLTKEAINSSTDAREDPLQRSVAAPWCRCCMRPRRGGLNERLEERKKRKVVVTQGGGEWLRYEVE